MSSLEEINGAADFIASLKRSDFDENAMRLFHWQYANNPLYKQYADAIHRKPAKVREVADIPFLPISFFKTHNVASGVWERADLVFRSSGTTAGADVRSTHNVRSAAIYEQTLLRGFNEVYGSLDEWAVLALLPSYVERDDSSLVHMATSLMKESKHPANDFYLTDFEKLKTVLQTLEGKQVKTLLLGVTFALLDFAAQYPMELRNTTVMETGGMKGRREEWTREQVHDFLKAQWQVKRVHSEYGMTELLSQAYAPADGIFYPASTMRVLVRDVNDPLDVKTSGAGVLNVIDLANIYSCAFIATEDLGWVNPDGTFRVVGRMDHSALRGCSLMAA